jgi:endonuclease/exonuclease/phosphatase family metal-dependent hydrolase
MPPFGKPFNYSYNLQKEKTYFNKLFNKDNHDFPKKLKREIDLVTWNIANLGVQKRSNKDYELIAFIISKFDIIAVQEVNEELGGFNKVMKHLKKKGYDYILNDSAGNNERLAVIYKKSLLRPRHLAGEIDYNPTGKIIDKKYVVKPKTVKVKAKGGKIRHLKFYNFNRNPFITSWEVIKTGYTFVLVNVHIYWGKADPKDLKSKQKEAARAKFNNRVAELFYLAEWSRKKSNMKNGKKVYDNNIIMLGDMNLPSSDPTDYAFEALRKHGMRTSPHATSACKKKDEEHTYDQIIFTKNKIKVKSIDKKHRTEVIDFDNYIFPDLYTKRGLKDYNVWVKFAISDHRPLLTRLKV